MIYVNILIKTKTKCGGFAGERRSLNKKGSSSIRSSNSSSTGKSSSKNYIFKLKEPLKCGGYFCRL